MLSFHIDFILLRLLRLVCNRVESIVLPHPIFRFYGFWDLPRASALFVTTDCIVVS